LRAGGEPENRLPAKCNIGIEGIAAIGKTVDMKRTWVLLSIGLIALCGCAQHYVMKLSNGVQVTTPHKPKLIHGAYHYKDSTGKERTVSAGRVREIEPASMAREEQQTFKPAGPKKRHWYLLWIA
jgi:hypothetical protein